MITTFRISASIQIGLKKVQNCAKCTKGISQIELHRISSPKIWLMNFCKWRNCGNLAAAKYPEIFSNYRVVFLLVPKSHFFVLVPHVFLFIKWSGRTNLVWTPIHRNNFKEPVKNTLYIYYWYISFCTFIILIIYYTSYLQICKISRNLLFSDSESDC